MEIKELEKFQKHLERQNITIEDVKKCEAKLRQDVAGLFMQFSKETGIVIHFTSVQHIAQIGEGIKHYIVDFEYDL